MSRAWTVLDITSHPAGWRVRRVGDVAELTNGYPFNSEDFGPDGMPLVRIRDLFLDEFETYVRGPVPDAVVLRDGDVVIGMDGDFELTVWKRGPAALNQRMCLLRARAGTDPRFLAYALPRHLGVINDLTYATTVKHLSSFEILAERMAFPPFGEQRAIADHLDAVTRRVASAMQSLDRMGALLRERRTALLGEVMAGLHPESVVAMRAAVPRKLSAYAEVDLGKARSPESAEGPWMTPYLRAANVKNGSLNLDSVLEMNFNPREQERYALRAGDILVTEGAGSIAAVGANAVYRGELNRRVCFQNHLLRVRARQQCDPGFLAWWMRFAYESGLLATLASGAQILNLGSEEVRSLLVRFPDRQDQQRIANYLDAQISQTERLVRAVEAQRDLLQERRQAVVTAAVTGQLETPGVAA